MAMLSGIILLLETNAKLGVRSCGIPIVFWLDIFFLLFGLRSFGQLMKIYVIRNFYSRVVYFDVMKLVFIDGFLIGWLIYGNFLYYSPKNNCAAIADT